MLILMPTYAIAPCTGPHTRVGSNSRPHGSDAPMMGFFCLNAVRFSPPIYMEKWRNQRVTCALNWQKLPNVSSHDIVPSAN